MNWKIWASGLFILAISVASFADTRKITSTAAPATRPALKYRLFPDPSTLKNGNAIDVYMKNQAEIEALNDEADLQQFARSILNDEELAHGVECVEKNGQLVDQAKAAAKLDRCLLEPIQFESLRPFKASNQIETLAGIAMLKARTASNVEEATQWMSIATQIGFHLADSGNQHMVSSGMRIERCVVEMATEKGSSKNWPNLYWSIAQLPSQKACVVKTFNHEMRGFKDAMKASKDPMDITPEDLAEIYMNFAPLEKKDNKPGFGDKMEVLMRGILAQGAAENYMKLKGFSEAQIKALSANQVICYFYFNPIHEFSDEYEKLSQSPYPYAIEQVHRLNEEMTRETVKGRTREGDFVAKNLVNPFQQLTELSVFSFELLLKNQGLLERQIAIGKLIEAMRDYAFWNNGDLPQTLDDIKNLPVDLNPMTGKAFEWKKTAKAGKGTLSAPRSPQDHNDSSIEYEIEINKR